MSVDAHKIVHAIGSTIYRSQHASRPREALASLVAAARLMGCEFIADEEDGKLVSIRLDEAYFDLPTPIRFPLAFQGFLQDS